MSSCVPIVEDPRKLTPEERQSYKKHLMAKLHLDYPEFDWLMVNAITDHYLEHPDEGPEELLAKYDPKIFAPPPEEEEKKKDASTQTTTTATREEEGEKQQQRPPPRPMLEDITNKPELWQQNQPGGYISLGGSSPRR